MRASDMAPGPLLVDVAGTNLTSADRELLADPTVGGAILFTRNFKSRAQLSDLTEQMRETRADLLIVADYEGGRVQRFVDGFTRIPPMARLGQLYRRTPAEALTAAADLGWLVARELGEVGIDMPLAPVTDRDHGTSTVIGHRAFSDRPADIVALAEAYSRGLVAGGSVATIKHFPGHGWVAADSHAELPVDDRDRDALTADWQPFAELIRAGVASVMMAHVRYPAVDHRPASLSPVWIGDMLRERLGFAGCVFCDDLSMGGAAAAGDIAGRVQAALAAGCDYLPVCNDRESALVACRAVHEAVDTGQTRRQALIHAVGRHRQATTEDEPRRARARHMAEILCSP